MRTFLLLFICAMLVGCSRTTYPGLPSLPQKDWLSAGQPKEAPATEKYAIYSPDKVMTFEDLVWLAVQESPVLSRGTINLEVQEINKTDAKWRYLPEMHLIYTISNNITKYNDGKSYAGKNYGETSYQLQFSGFFNNPLATYFSVQAQDELMRVAIVTQRKAIAETIFNIASTLLRVNKQEKIIALFERMLEQSRKKLTYREATARQDNNLYDPASHAEDNVADIELRLREAKMALMLERTRLKQLVGLDLNKALKVDSKSVFPVLDSFHPSQLDWETCWERTEDRYILRQQVRLEQANVMLAWAQYMPNISLGINENAPNGQSQPSEGQTDEFLHLTFDFPLLDWGHRWRMADIANARKRQNQLDEIQRTREYGERWLTHEQQNLLAAAKVERWQRTAKNAHRREEAIQTAYQNGAASFDAVADFGQRGLDSEIATQDAECNLAQAKLAWMHFASLLSNHFLGDAGYEKIDK